MGLFELGRDKLAKLSETSFATEGVQERAHLQSLLRDQIDIICPDAMVLDEEHGNWADSRRRIDLLALDRDANLVVIEFKRTETGGHMELQALRYAAMVSMMTFREAVEAHRAYLARRGKEGADAEQAILDFLGWSEPSEEKFANDVRIVLASAEFSKELSSTVLWLNERDLDIRCVRLRPYRHGDRVLVDVQQIIPLPEASEYRVRSKEKAESKRAERTAGSDWTQYDLTVGGKHHANLRKRRLVYLVAEAAVRESGAAPEDITRTVSRSNLWVTVDGECDAEEFARRASGLRTKTGATYDLRRYFTGDDDLIRHRGRTYAFTNQWGGAGALAAVDAIARQYPGLAIEYAPSAEE